MFQDEYEQHQQQQSGGDEGSSGSENQDFNQDDQHTSKENQIRVNFEPKRGRGRRKTVWGGESDEKRSKPVKDLTRKALASARTEIPRYQPERAKRRAEEEDDDGDDDSGKVKDEPDAVDEDMESKEDSGLGGGKEKKRSRSLAAVATPPNMAAWQNLAQVMAVANQQPLATEEVKVKRGPGRPPKYPRPNADGSINSDINSSLSSLLPMSFLPLLNAQNTAQLGQSLHSPLSGMDLESMFCFFICNLCLINEIALSTSKVRFFSLIIFEVQWYDWIISSFR